MACVSLLSPEGLVHAERAVRLLEEENAPAVGLSVAQAAPRLQALLDALNTLSSLLGKLVGTLICFATSLLDEIFG
jgi:hypothetical protein